MRKIFSVFLSLALIASQLAPAAASDSGVVDSGDVTLTDTPVEVPPLDGETPADETQSDAPQPAAPDTEPAVTEPEKTEELAVDSTAALSDQGAVTSFTDEATGLKFYVDEEAPEEVSLGGANNGVTELIVPQTVSYEGVDYTVTAVHSQAFYGNRAITAVVLPDTVTTIGEYAFQYCSNLTSVEFGKGLKTIQKQAFYECSELTGVEFVDGLTEIGEGAFQRCTALTEVRLPESLTTIGNTAFWLCTNIQHLTLPGSLGEINEMAFSDLTGLTSITLGEGITTIPEFMLSNTKLTTIQLPESLETIEKCAFQYSPLTEIVIPANVTSIGEQAFNGCMQLERVEIQGQNVTIGDNAFQSCYQVTAVTAGSPGGSIQIGKGAFKSLINLETVLLPEGVTAIGPQAFNNCPKLTDLQLPDSVETIGDEAFSYNRGLTGVLELPAGLQHMGNSAFEGCSGLTGITFPASLEVIGDEAFAYLDSLTGELVLPTNLRQLGAQAFYNCQKLEGVTIPGGVETIGDRAFDECRSLSSLTISDGVGAIGDEAFAHCNQLKTLTIPGSVKTIGTSAFRDCYNLSSLTISDGVEVIGESAFENCNPLEALDIPFSVKRIGAKAFYGCYVLKDVIIDNDVMPQLGENAFNPETSVRLRQDAAVGKTFEDGGFRYTVLTRETARIDGAVDANASGTWTELIIPEQAVFEGKQYLVTAVGEDAFQNYGYLEAVQMPDTITAVGMEAFAGSKLPDLKLPLNLETIGNGAFRNTSGYSELILPDSLKTIGDSAFQYVYDYTSIILPAGLTEIGAHAFYNSSLNYVAYHEKMPEKIGEKAFPDQVVFEPLLDLHVGDRFTQDGMVYEITSLAPAEATLVDWQGTEDEVTVQKELYYGGRAFLVTAIGESAFAGSSITKITLPVGVKTIENGAFQGCQSLQTLEFTEPAWNESATLEGIGDHAFQDCTALGTVYYLPESLKEIGDYAFAGCTNMKEIRFSGDAVPTLGKDALPDGILGSLPGGASMIQSFSDGTFLYCAIDGIRLAVVGVEDKTIGTATLPQTAVYTNSEGKKLTYPVTGIGTNEFSNANFIRVLEGSSVQHLIVPEGYTQIDEYGLLESETLQTLTLPDSMKEIRAGAVQNSSNLKKVVIGAGIESIGDSAFALCSSLSQVYIYAETPPQLSDNAFANREGGIPENLTIFVPEKYADRYKSDAQWGRYHIVASESAAEFDGMLFRIWNDGTATLLGYAGNRDSETLTVPEQITYRGQTYSVAAIQDGAFQDTAGLKEVTIPASVASVGRLAFSGCTDLQIVHMMSETPPHTLGADAFPADVTILVPDAGFDAYRSDEAWGQYYIRSDSYLEVDGLLYRVMEGTNEVAVYGCSDPSSVGSHLVIPESVVYDGQTYTVTAVGDRAFSQNPTLVEVTLPQGIASIGNSAFAGCSSLEKVYIQASKAPKLGSSAFPLGVQVYPSVYESGYEKDEAWQDYRVMMGGETQDYVVVGNIRYALFRSDVPTVDSTATVLGFDDLEAAKENGSLLIPATVQYENKSYQVTTVAAGAFQNDSWLQFVEIGANVTLIQPWAFQGTGISALHVPEGMLEIRTGAFQGCTELRELHIPGNRSGGTNIGDRAFQDCTDLFTLELQEVKNIGDSAFQGCTTLAQLHLNLPLKNVGAYAFADCTGLKEVTTEKRDPQQWLVMGEGVFSGCSGLTTVNTLMQFSNLPDRMFEDCISLQSTGYLVAQNIGEAAYKNCTSLTDIDFGDAILIGANAFENCTSLTDIALSEGNPPYSEGIVYIGESAFVGCTGLQTVTIPNSVEQIDPYAFASTGLKEVVMKNDQAPKLIPGENHFPSPDIFIMVPRQSFGYDQLGWEVYTNINGDPGEPKSPQPTGNEGTNGKDLLIDHFKADSGEVETINQMIDYNNLKAPRTAPWEWDSTDTSEYGLVVWNFEDYDLNPNMTYQIQEVNFQGDCTVGMKGDVYLSNLTRLEKVVAASSYIRSLDLSGCIRLETIEDIDQFHNLQALNLSGCTAMTQLPEGIEALQKLASLNVSGAALSDLYLTNSNIQSIDASGSEKLKILDCSNNSKLTQLNLQDCEALQTVICLNTALTQLDVKGQALDLLVCDENLKVVNGENVGTLVRVKVQGDGQVTAEVQDKTVTLTAVPGEGQRLKRWTTPTGTSKDAVLVLTDTTDDMTITAEFVDESVSDVELGDIDGNGVVNILDVNKLFRHVNKQITLTDAELEGADVDRSGSIDIMDVNKLFRFVNKQIPTL